MLRPLAPVHGTELEPVAVPVALGCLPRHFSIPSFFCASE
jgi:hypothetical protein